MTLALRKIDLTGHFPKVLRKIAEFDYFVTLTVANRIGYTFHPKAEHGRNTGGTRRNASVRSTRFGLD